MSSPDFVLSLFDDPEMIEKGWVTSYEHPVVGRMDAMGLLFDFSETPGRIMGPPFVPGQHSRQILHELGYATDAGSTTWPARTSSSTASKLPLPSKIWFPANSKEWPRAA